VLRLEAEHAIPKQRIDKLENGKEQARRNELVEQKKRGAFTERNQRLEAESKVIEERNMRLQAEQWLQSQWIDELENEKRQALSNDLLEQEKRQWESDLLKERNQGLDVELKVIQEKNMKLEAESMVIEERNRRLEAERMVQVKWIDELEKEKEQAQRNDLQRESELLKEKNQRLEAEIHADSHLNHTLKVFT
jgi:fused signal recognition particle receptor